MPTYYRGPCARITHEVIEVWCPSYQSYAIRHLSSAWIERMGSTAVRPLSAGSASIAGAVAAIVALGRSAGLEAFRSPLPLLLTFGIFIASVIVSWACWRTGEVDQRLVGIYCNVEVIIYQDADLQRFAQVARALNRALEWVEDIQ